MARINIPGLKKSTGIPSFDPLVDGDYELKVLEWKEKEDKNHEPVDIFAFTFEVMSGPPQADGKSPKGRRYWNDFRIMRPEHPRMTGKEPEDQFDVGKLKSFIVAANIEMKGDAVNFDTAVGATVGAKITQTKSKTDETKIFNNVKSWYGIDD